MKPQKILIDTDLGDDVDDILALVFALLRPELDVKAIAAVSYDTEKRGHLIAQLLEIMGRTEIPFAAGMRRPLPEFRPTKRRISMIRVAIVSINIRLSKISNRCPQHAKMRLR